MSYFRASDQHNSQAKFATIPPVEDGDIPFVQAVSSIGDGKTSTASEASTQCGISLREGDLITGLIDITNERAHMVPAIRRKDHENQKKDLVRACVRPAGHLSNLMYPFLLGGVPSPCTSSRQNIGTRGVWTTLPTQLGVRFRVPLLIHNDF